MMVSPHYTEMQWNAAFDDGREDWDKAIKIVEDRIRGRWLDAVERLLDEPHSGFAILALDSIVLESMWGFMNGKAFPKGRERQAYQDILTGPRFGWTASQSEGFRTLVRNSIMHDAETRNRWLVEKTIPRDVILRKNDNGDYKLNRTKFHGALRAAFEDWIAKLRDDDSGLRAKMRKRMDQIIAIHYAAE